VSFTEEVAALYPAFKAAGMLSVATDGAGAFDVDFRRPPKLIGTYQNEISNEYEIEYQHADRPNLAEGDTLTLSGTPHASDAGTYRVRKPPYIDAPGNAADGTYRCAILTKIA
jgi:hypothetical protein